MQTKITLHHELITPQQAHTTILHEMYERQRPLNQSYVHQYALAIRKGEFREGTVMSFAVWNGRRYLINGQHTHHAIVLANQPILLGVEEIRVASYDEIARWYIKYDRVNLRTLEQGYRAHNLPEAVHMNQAQTVQVGSCLGLLASGFEPLPRTKGSLRMYISNPEVRMACVRAWQEEAAHFYDDIAGAPGTMGQNLRRSPVMALALVTYRFTGSDASEFWHATAMDDRLPKNDPRKRLHLHIRTSKLGDYLPHVYSRYVARAWNAAWNGLTPQTIQPQSTTSPIEIHGTPHTSAVILRYLTPDGEVLYDPIPYEPDAWHQGLFDVQAAAADTTR